ncbi:tagaturonate reductase [Paenibacillus sp. HJL G12]|uniref:Tagaturonate reductase n=1 Tax=Paenibacillus dendrobii TaxID=2691084 RepID=A0A7X3IHI4_9BACL|nr:tagaturonate reductase [Paenibacillus dendrobii]MWV43900.1 tagaturonate reductase [Paenibacillus dendrobii]
MSHPLSRTTHPHLPSYPERVIQFGGGNFMRAFVNWQLQQMNRQGLFQGSAVVVQPTERGLGDLMTRQDCLYTVLLNGIFQNRTVNSQEIITTVSRVINPYTHYEDYLALAEDDGLEFITSNTTEAGIAYHAGDCRGDQPPASFPAKLTALLFRRFELRKKGFVIIPCELIDRNGEKLHQLIEQYAREWQLGEAFVTWLREENTFCCSLVDRIVPGYPRGRDQELEHELGYTDELMVTAEPYLLWVIEGPEWLSERLPLDQTGLNVIFTDDMTPYRERKVHLLNGPHTAMVPLGLLAGLETVEEVMQDECFSRFVKEIMEKELAPMLNFPLEDVLAYASDIQERFRNPYIRHELRSISLNSISKFKARLLPILLRYQQEKGILPPLICLSFAALLLSYRGDRIPRQDLPEVNDVFDEAWSRPSSFVTTILRKESLWGADLTKIPGLIQTIEADIRQLDQSGSRAALQIMK